MHRWNRIESRERIVRLLHTGSREYSYGFYVSNELVMKNDVVVCLCILSLCIRLWRYFRLDNNYASIMLINKNQIFFVIGIDSLKVTFPCSNEYWTFLFIPMLSIFLELDFSINFRKILRLFAEIRDSLIDK